MPWGELEYVVALPRMVRGAVRAVVGRASVNLVCMLNPGSMENRRRDSQRVHCPTVHRLVLLLVAGESWNTVPVDTSAPGRGGEWRPTRRHRRQ